MNSTHLLRLGMAQMTSSDRLGENAKTMAQLFNQAVDQGAELVVFPENSLFFRLQPGQPMLAPHWGGDEFQLLAGVVNERRTPLLLTTPVRDESSKKMINATVFLKPGAEPRVVYSKIHLFDVDVPGAPPVRESEHFAHGLEPAILEFKGWKLGLTICYDLRFAELFLHYAQKVDALLVPSAFLVPTGQAHWHVLLRARAIESQAYVLAPAQAGQHTSGEHSRMTYGHSLAVDPWGQILSEISEPRVGTEVVTLDRELIKKVRQQIPMAGHRRLC